MGATTKDVSGNNRDHLWTGAGTLLHVQTLKPGGGDQDQAGTGAGWKCAGYEAIDFVGDDVNGFNTAPLVFEAVISDGNFAPPLMANVTIAEGGNGVKGWRLRIDGSANWCFEAKTSALAYKWTAPLNFRDGDDAPTIVQFAWSNGGLNGQFYAGTPYTLQQGNIVLLTTRAAFAMSVPSAHAVLAVPGVLKVNVSHYRILRQSRNDDGAKLFHDLVANST